MDKNRKKRFGVLLYWLAEKFPKAVGPRVISKSDLDDYYEALADIRIERLEWAAKWIFGHSRFFPRPAELREAAGMAPASVVPTLPIRNQAQIGDISPEQQKRMEAESKERIKAIQRKLCDAVAIKPKDSEQQAREKLKAQARAINGAT